MTHPTRAAVILDLTVDLAPKPEPNDDASPQVKRSAANFNAEELPLATSIFKGINYTRQKGPPESLRVGQDYYLAYRKLSHHGLYSDGFYL